MVTLLLATHVTLPHLRYGKLWEPSKQAPSSFSLEPAQIAGHVAGGHYHGRAAGSHTSSRAARARPWAQSFREVLTLDRLIAAANPRAILLKSIKDELP